MVHALVYQICMKDLLCADTVYELEIWRWITFCIILRLFTLHNNAQFIQFIQSVQHTCLTIKFTIKGKPLNLLSNPRTNDHQNYQNLQIHSQFHSLFFLSRSNYYLNLSFKFPFFSPNPYCFSSPFFLRV